MSMSGTRPRRSEARPAIKRIEMEAMTMMVLKEPLYTYPNEPTKSGEMVKNVPKAKATGNKPSAAGHEDRSMTSPFQTCRSAHFTRRPWGKVSGNLSVMTKAIKPKSVETMNIAL